MMKRFIILNHYSNFQIITAEDNLAKSDYLLQIRKPKESTRQS